VARPHAFFIALLLALALVSGSYAVMRTTALGLSAEQPASGSDRQIAARKARLDKIEAALARALAKKPPTLPGLPKRRPAPAARPVSRAAPVSAAIPASNPFSSSSSSFEPNDGGGSEDDGEGGDD
jgi:hypothetical protein